MELKEDSLERTAEAVDDLFKLLELSHDAAVRLKKDIPGENFPVAYKLTKSIEVLQSAVEELKNNIDGSMLSMSFNVTSHDNITSSDRLS